MSACLLYIIYAGVTKTLNWILLIAVIAIFIEGIALILNKYRCPLTTLAEKYGAEKGSVTDIFLPAWIARHVFTGSIILFFSELVLLGFRYFSGL
jgi:hypothetical protein